MTDFEIELIRNNLHNFLFQYCKEVCVTTKCGEFTLPDNHLKSCKTCDADGRRCRENAPNRKARGIENADFVLYVSALPTSQCSETIGMYLIQVILKKNARHTY